uniref:Uncharacterized protein n=1 Tax=Setaria viridis TaxID=4556 RepID=A0A4U6UY34_SETVI|nr:hypothetical protein SEVIR_4G074800v2 [Setaria viridis]
MGTPQVSRGVAGPDVRTCALVRLPAKATRQRLLLPSPFLRRGGERSEKILARYYRDRDGLGCACMILNQNKRGLGVADRLFVCFTWKRLALSSIQVFCIPC